MKYDPQAFSVLLTRAMDGMTKKDFARKCGISHELLTRYTSSTSPLRPTKNALRKIADHSAVTLDELLAVCEYRTERMDMSFPTRAQMNVEDTKNGLHQMTVHIALCSSLGEFMEQFKKMYSKEAIRYAFGRQRENEDEFRNRAEYSIPVCTWFETDKRECRTWFVLYYCKTIGGQYIVTDYAMDGKSLIQARAFSGRTLQFMADKGQAIGDMPYFFQTRDLMGAEERLLQAIFGEEKEKKGYLIPIVGFGFELEEEVPEEFAGFVLKHRDVFITNEEEEEFVQKLQTPMSKTEIESMFSEYEDEETWNEGYGAAISKIMRNETGLDFVYHEEKHGAKACVMLTDDDEDYNIDVLVQKVRPFAKELGIQEYGEIITYTEGKINSKRYLAEEGEDKE